jgi:hypothetical protein
MTGSSCPDDMDDFSPDLSFSSVVAALLREPIVGKKMPGCATVKHMAAIAVILAEKVSYYHIKVTVYHEVLTFHRAP